MSSPSPAAPPQYNIIISIQITRGKISIYKINSLLVVCRDGNGAEFNCYGPGRPLHIRRIARRRSNLDVQKSNVYHPRGPNR